MSFVRWAVTGVALALLAGSSGDTDSNIFRRPSEPATLDGTWVIVSVRRDGQADPTQVGARLTFANGKIGFRPKVRQINLNDIS
jgi:hypothetical protein